MYLKSNLKFLRERKGKTQQEVADSIKFKREDVKNYENGTEPPLERLVALSEYYKISIDVLVKVNLSKVSGSKLQLLEEGHDAYVTGKHIRVLAKAVDGENNEVIELVPVKAQAGYTSGYNDTEYIEKLPIIKLPFLSREKKYRAFQLRGPSMNPIPEDAYVIGSYVENWNYIQDGNAYVIITEFDGVVFKIVYQDKKKKKLLLKSLNPEFKPYEIEMKDVREIWEFVQYLSAELPEPKSDIDAVFRQLAELNKKVS